MARGQRSAAAGGGPARSGGSLLASQSDEPTAVVSDALRPSPLVLPSPDLRFQPRLMVAMGSAMAWGWPLAAVLGSMRQRLELGGGSSIAVRRKRTRRP